MPCLPLPEGGKERAAGLPFRTRVNSLARSVLGSFRREGERKAMASFGMIIGDVPKKTRHNDGCEARRVRDRFRRGKGNGVPFLACRNFFPYHAVHEKREVSHARSLSVL